jgi:predicted metalloprotease with PDZ domain
VHPKDGTEYSYYPKGSLAGLLLDITIRDASDNKRSLDTVMRELYETTYSKGRGFTHDDFWGAVSRAANGRSFDEFEQKYIDGREPYPWATALPLVGLRLIPDSIPRIGVTTANDPSGAIRVMELEPGSTAATSGVKVGDELVSVGEIPVADQSFAPRFRLKYTGRAAGSPLIITVKRGTESLTLHGVLRYSAVAPRLDEDPSASAKAVRVRNGILRGITAAP